MNKSEARAYALDTLRHLAQHPRFNRERFTRSMQGYGAPGELGWMVSGGTMYVPGHMCSDAYRFPLAGLFRELDSPQMESN